jgi:hypothetical protein
MHGLDNPRGAPHVLDLARRLDRPLPIDQGGCVDEPGIGQVLLERSQASGAEVSSEMKPTVSEKITRAPCGSFAARNVGSSVANRRSSAMTSDAVSLLNSVDFPAFV